MTDPNQAIELRDGVYYPMGGFARVGEALGTVCKDLGVKFRFDCPVSEVCVCAVLSVNPTRGRGGQFKNVER